MFSYIAKIINALNANVKPSQIANGFCLGLILGFVPKTNLLWYILFVFFLFVRVNKGAYLLFTLVGSLVAPRLDVFFDNIGYKVLMLPQLVPTFSKLIDIPFVGFTKFNNTIVAGSLVCGMAAYIPLFILIVLFVKVYRQSIAPAINNSALADAIRKVPLIGDIIKKVAEAKFDLEIDV